MPIVIPRDGSAEPKATNPLTPEQKRELWEHIVLAWCQKNPEQLQEAVSPAAPSGLRL